MQVWSLFLSLFLGKVRQSQDQLHHGTAFRGTSLKKLEVWGFPRRTSQKFASEGFRLDISTPRKRLRSMGPLSETSTRTPPRTSEKSFQELFQSQGWLEDHLRKGTQRRFLQKTADFRRFTCFPGNSSMWRAQETAEDRRFSQETKDFRRKPQETAAWAPSP